jgi:hypothetical protein
MLIAHRLGNVAVRLFAVILIVSLSVTAFAQDDPTVSGVGEDQQQDGPVATEEPGSPPPSGVLDVIGQWGTAPTIGADADEALARRWFRNQNAARGRWAVPTAQRDPYLDWQAENALRGSLGEPLLPAPPGVSAPGAGTSQREQGLLSESEFWTVSDDLWQAWLDSFQIGPSEYWQESHPGEVWYTRERYLKLFVLGQMPRFDRYRILGVAGRVDSKNLGPAPLLPGNEAELEAVAPGSVGAYLPVRYAGNIVAVVGMDPWISADGTLRP